jgi:hypothetical protein
MWLLPTINVLNTVMFILVIIGFVLCALALFRAMRGSKKIPYISLSFLLIPILVIGISKPYIKYVFSSAVTDYEANITVDTKIKSDPRDLLNRVMSNLYRSKGRSGSSPTAYKHIINVCKENVCGHLEIARDSRDVSMYWVRYMPFSGSYSPLGFVLLEAQL